MPGKLFRFLGKLFHEKSQVNPIVFLLSGIHYQFDVEGFFVIAILESLPYNGEKNGNMFPMRVPVYIQIRS